MSSETIKKSLGSSGLAPALPLEEAKIVAAQALTPLAGLSVYARSITACDGALLFLGREAGNDGAKTLAILEESVTIGAGFGGATRQVDLDGSSMQLTTIAADEHSAARLRSRLPYLVARPLGLQKSAGTGDRLGLATPGHIRAFRSTFGEDQIDAMAPIFAQQSIRENARTGRSPQEVIDDAMWGVFQEGWRHGFGADADHLKNTDDVDVCVAAGYTFYTVDPGDYVDDEANTAGIGVLQAKVEALPWAILESSPADLLSQLANRALDLGALSVTLSDEDVLRAAAKYGQAVAHTASMYRHLTDTIGDAPFELEMSVDETETVTSLSEHIYIAAELQRMGVKVVSLAPRYVGTFEKGVDYIGDLDDFERSITQHMAVSSTYGPYKLSLHSGSDKFSIYPIAARVAGDLVHLKTAGTSYLEALRTIANVNPALFRSIAEFGVDRYPTDRASYHVSAEIARMPVIAQLQDGQLPTLLENFDAREILHVTFGSVLNHEPFRAPFFATLVANEERYSEILDAHFIRHLEPFK